MANHLDGDRKQLNQAGPGRVGYRILIALGIIVAGIALAVWRHAG
jgi:hypothetical protein